MQSISKEEILAQRFYNQGLIKLKKWLHYCLSALVHLSSEILLPGLARNSPCP